MGTLDEKVIDLVLQAVEKVVGAIKHSSVELLLQGQAENSKKYMGELKTIVT